MPPLIALLDANVLYPAELRSFLMYLAVPGSIARSGPRIFMKSGCPTCSSIGLTSQERSWSEPES
jgi:hypothetical protein